MLSPVIQYLWGLINSLQIIVLTNLFDIPQIPYNIKKILVKISELVAFDFIETEEIYSQLFGFGEQSDLNLTFKQAKFDGSNFIQLLGPILLIIFGWLT